jgi:hypothetical protein
VTTFTYRVETDPDSQTPIAWIDADGSPVIRQPHHPNAVLNPDDPSQGNWEDNVTAAAWAAAYCVQLAAEEQAAIDAAAAQQAAEEQAAQQAADDRDRLVRIEQMLTQLLAK